MVDVKAEASERNVSAKGTIMVPKQETDILTGMLIETTVPVEVELPVIWSEDGNAICYVTFEHNDKVNTLHCPVETWKSGKHILSLYYPIEDVMPNITNTFNVYLRLEHGTGSVGVGDCIASISGQAMAAAATWDGVIENEEKTKRFAIGGGLAVKRISDAMDTDLLEYVKRTYTEQMQERTVIGAFCRPVEQEEE